MTNDPLPPDPSALESREAEGVPAPSTAPPPVSVLEGDTSARSTRPRGRKRAIAAVVAILVLAAAWFGWRTNAGIEATFAEQDRVVALDERAFESIPVLTDDEIATLRRSRNARHVELARELGVDPPDTRAQADSLADAGRLVRIETDSLYTVLPMDSSVPY
ncbi:hypothetical protein, partial [Rubrivirga sp.]|uniref:hypothetical protein n=1 Tax=Rubrivirga sp. TaxID=1885344 RepID=UPI003C78A416